MRHVSAVFQDVTLFAGSIRDNITIGRPDATEAELSEAVRLAQLDELVARLPQGLDTPAGRSGARLSQGERQRVSIARAFLKDAPVLLLDEATASLDAANQAAVSQALQALTRNRTVIAVTHQMETARRADQILFLHRGQVAEAGTHDALMALDGAYSRYCKLRATSSGWRLPANK
ncbi:MAG: ABC transporter ATP-binding protein/permease, partial [Epibacterium sp.]|nr:ABC transporter ATP-binding protein/permease [Epibacterium sp.]NQX76087.1 ABC transporter ATP-binding protein [Epibacterium sp.]